MNAYTILSGIFPKYLNGENIISVPLAENETMHIGYVLNENQELSELGKAIWKNYGNMLQPIYSRKLWIII